MEGRRGGGRGEGSTWEVTSHRAASAAHTTITSHTLSVYVFALATQVREGAAWGGGGGVNVGREGHDVKQHQLHTPLSPVIHCQSTSSLLLHR